MIEITVDATAIKKTLDTMVENIAHFPYDMDKEFIDWQTQDMHRQRPFTKLDAGASANTYTIILSDYTRKMMQSRGPKRLVIQQRGTISVRPILRVELLDKLKERMKALLHNCLKWVKGENNGG